MGADQDRRGVIAARLDHLFATVHPRGRGPYTLREVAQAINAEAGENLISVSYLSYLRAGRRSEPSASRLAAIARFFGVPVSYFTSDEKAEETDQQLAIAEALRDSELLGITLRAAGLSPRSLKAIRGMVEQARELENLSGEEGTAGTQSR
jgi:transcriptional regulator with XRE-family HTH domain